MNNVTHRHIEEVHSIVRTAVMNHQVWWCLSSDDCRPKYPPTMNAYLNFFATSMNSHFAVCVTALYALYETRKDTYNFPRLSVELRSTKSFQPAAQAKLDSMIRLAKPTWKKVAILRNEAYAHVSNSRRLASTFAKANATPEELAELIRLAKATISFAHRASYGFGYSFNKKARDDTLRLVRALHAKNGA